MHFDCAQYKQKGIAPILILFIIAALVGGYLIYQKQIKPAIAPQPIIQISPSPTAVSINNTYPSELQGYPIYPDSKFIKKETKTPSDYDCKYYGSSLACIGNTSNYIFEVDIPSNREDDFIAWYRDPKKLLGWRFTGGADGISDFTKDNNSFELLWGPPVNWGSPTNTSTVDNSKTEFTLRLPNK